MSIFVPLPEGASVDSIVALARPRFLVSRALAPSTTRRFASSASLRSTSVAKVRLIGPSFTCMVAFQLFSSTTSSSFAPGMQGTMRGTSMRRSHAFSGGAATSNEFSSLKR